MDQPLELVFRGVDKSDSLVGLINEKVDKLNKICNYMNSCRIAVEKPQEHQRSGSPYRVRIDIRVPPGHEIVIRREPGDGNQHDTLETVLREAFGSAKRKLKEITDKQHAEVKKHPGQQVGAVVAELDKKEGYGFLLSTDGRRIYFHRNAVTNHDFDRIELGTGVHYVEREGDKGPQASTVHIVDKPGARVKNTEE